MTTLTLEPTTRHRRVLDLERLSARFGVAFTICQISVMVVMATVVLPKGGNPSDPALDRGARVLDAATLYQVGNYLFLVAGLLLLGFLGVVHARTRQADPTGVLTTVAVAAGTLLAFVWPFAGVLHDVALDAGRDGVDLRLLGAWDAVAPYSLAFSALPRLFFVGALVLALRATGSAPWLQRIGVVILVLSAIGSATLVTGAVFPVLALSTLVYELWIGALAVHWLRQPARTTA